jgi:hypothetical protein
MRRMMIGCLGGIARNVIDSFDRANSTNSLGNADTGQPWINSVVLGNPIGISSNAAYSASAVDCTAVVDCVSSDGSLSIVVGAFADNMGITFRYSDNSNYVYAVVSNSVSKFYITGRLAGTVFGGSTASGYYISGVTLSAGDTLKIIMSGTSITAYVNGVSKGTLTIAQNASNKKHGIKINGTTARIDSFEFIPA